MKIYIKGQQSSDVDLTDSNFITEGGEGKIYGKQGVVYKIYFDSKKVIKQAKIDDLIALDKNNILRPLDIVLDSHKVPIGFTMRWVKNVIAICKLFTNDFRNRMGVTPEMINELVTNLAKDIQFIHEKKCLIVDANEMNFLVDSNYITPYFIDVDSYQTEHFPATAISPAIQDYHTKGFSEYTDWFSFAIIAFQLFIGIHPYKGTHPKYKKFDLEKRMIDNVSVLNSKVSLPSSVRDLSYIPTNYKDWFYNMFEKGERNLPPAITGVIFVVKKARVVQGTDQFEIELIKTFSSEIIRYENEVVFLESHAYYKNYAIRSTRSTEAVFTRVSNDLIFVDIVNHKLKIKQLMKEETECNYDATDKMIFNNSIFILNNDKIFEIELQEFSGKLVPYVKSNWNVLPNATTVFKGVIYQNILGVPYLMVPYYMANGKTACFMNPINELKGYKVLEAKRDGHVVMVIANKNNKYDRFVFIFGSEYKDYRCRKDEDVSFHVPNFVTLENGIAVCITEEDKVEIFNSLSSKDDVKIVEDPEITFDMKLYKKGANVFIVRENQLFSFKMKGAKNEKS